MPTRAPRAKPFDVVATFRFFHERLELLLGQFEPPAPARVVAEDDVIDATVVRSVHEPREAHGESERWVSDSARGSAMSTGVHVDGGRLRRLAVAHQPVVEHDDGQVSALVVRGSADAA